MATVDQLVTRLEDLSAEVCSEKVTARNKAIDQVKQIFDSSPSTVQAILTGSQVSSLTPKYVFTNVFNGLLKHATRQEQSQSQRTDNKAPVFITIVQYLIDYCNQVEANRIPTSLIFDSVLSIFEDVFYSRQYGVQFLNILVQYLSTPNHSNFFNIDKTLWRRLLEGCKQMYECSGQGQRNHAIQCMAKILELGAEYSYLSDVLVDFVPFVESILCDHDNINVPRIGFLLTTNLCVSYQYSMCLFSENVSQYLLKSYKTNMKEEMKCQIFEYLHLVMVIHEPRSATAHDHFNKSDWAALRGSIESVVEEELNYLHEYKFTRDCDVLPEPLLSCASYLYYLLMQQPTDDIVLVECDDEAVSPRAGKRIRTSSELEKLLNKTRPCEKKFVWRWFVVLGGALNRRPVLALPPHEISALVRLCAHSTEDLTYEKQFKALYRIGQYLVDSPHADTIDWEGLARGVFKCACKYQSVHSVELLQFLLANRLCPPKLVLEIYNAIVSGPVDEMNLKSLSLMYQMEDFKEIVADSLLSNDEIVHFLNSNGGLILSRSCFSNAIEWFLICLDAGTRAGQVAHQSLKLTPFDESIERIMQSIEMKAIDPVIETTVDDQMQARERPQIRSGDINQVLIRKLFKYIYAEANESQHISVVVELMLRQLEFTVRFLSQLATVVKISEAGPRIGDILLKFEGALSGLTKAFKSQITEDGPVINKLLECLNYFLVVDYTREMKPVLDSSGFSLQVAIWTHHQFIAEGDRRKIKSLRGEGGSTSAIHARNSLVMEILLRLGAIQEGILQQYWFETEINAATDVSISVAILKKISKISPNISIVKIVIAELEDIFTSHHKNEKISHLVLEILTEYLVVFKRFPISINDWDRFVKQYILWGCKQKYSPKLTIQLLEFYEQFFEQFSEHRDLNQELQDYMAESLSLFLSSKNVAIQMKTAKVLVKICSTNGRFKRDAVDMSSAIGYCKFINGLFTNLQWKNVMDIDSMGEGDARMVLTDEVQNQKALMHYLLCGIALNNESLATHALKILIKFYHRNINLKRDSRVPVASIVDRQITVLVGSFLDMDTQISMFPYFLTNSRSIEAFLKKYQVAIGASFMRSGAWKDFIDLTKKYRLECAVEPLHDIFIVYSLIPSHELNNGPHFKRNLSQLLRPNFTCNNLQARHQVALLKHLHNAYSDEAEFLELFRFPLSSLESTTDPFTINNDQYSQVIETLDSTAVKNNELFIVDMCTRYPHSILLLMSHFQEQVQSAEFLIDKLKGLHKLIKFNKLVLQFVSRASHNSQIDGYKGYIVKDTILFLLTVTCSDRDIPNAVKVPLLGLILDMIKRTISQCLQTYKDTLNRMISLMVDLAVSNRDDSALCETIVEALKYFLVDSRQLLAETLDTIDILPEDLPEFEYVSIVQLNHAKPTIRGEIERFLAVPKRSVHSLRYLRRKISEEEIEFIELFKELKRGLRSIPNTDNVVHRLVLALLRCVKEGGEEVRIEASKILGDLGPVDLNTMILTSSTHQQQLNGAFHSKSAAISHFLPDIVTSLQDLQYKYTPYVPLRVLEALVPLMQLPEAAELLKRRKDLIIFKDAQIVRDSNGELESEKYVSELELFAGFSVKQFSRATFNDWIQKNVKLMLAYFNLPWLQKVVEREPSFGVQLFPLLISMALSLDEEPIKDAMGETFTNFFQDFETAKKNAHASSSLMLNGDLLKLMLDSVEIIRIYNQTTTEQINLNYLSIGAAAQHCNLHASAVLYGELWVEQETLSRKCSESDLPLPELRALMIPSYEALEVHDAVKPFLDLNQSRHKYYVSENSWEFAYLEATAAISGKRIDRQESMNETGRFQFAESAPNYEAIWRMSDWDQLKCLTLDEGKGRLPGTVDMFQKNHCLALKSLHCGDRMQSRRCLQVARDLVASNIAKSSLDCTKGTYASLTALRQIQQIHDVLDETRDWKAILQKWLRYDNLQPDSFEQQERILVQRISIMQSRSGQKGAPSVVGGSLRETVLKLIRLAKEDRNFRVAVTNLKNLENMELDTEIRARMILEDGHLHFIAGHRKLATHLYLTLINEEQFQQTSSKITALLLMAEYLTDNLMVSPNEILQTYLYPAETLCKAHSQTKSQRERGDPSTGLVRIHGTMARFADTIYTQRNNYMKSSEYAEKKKLHAESKAEFNAIDRQTLLKTGDQGAKMRIHNLRQTIVLEENQLKTVAEERKQYLHLAIKTYIKSCVINSDLHDLQICRIVSLWFTNIDDEFTGTVLQEHLSKIPSYKFLMILPQMAARLSHSDKVLTKTISEALVRCGQQHPHHSIYHVLALHNAHADNKSVEISCSMKTRLSNTAAIMKTLIEDKAIKKIVAAAQNLGMTLIHLANRDVKDTSDNVVGSELMSLRDMHRIAAPTIELPVQISSDYSTFPHVVSWVPKFQMVGGINCPKKLTFLCSDGISRNMLVKGKDDLRQDAVMQQVFHFMNVLLKNKKSSCKRNLSIRTYKIVPLTQMSGILEFCDNTNTLGNYLLQAHAKYRPEELPVAQCRLMMTECAKKKPEEKLKQFNSICKKFSPVFQHFFTENFFSPVEWFEKRMFYTNSVATTSMVGYIMGIGDRHVNNILIDKATAEVIHIDFGIALERGKLLPTPEKVPFRLTRDLVAAMGCFGVDGLFRTSCEITMQVLRENKALINTIVEVFLYDPLNTWFSSKKKVEVRQQQDDEEKNALAARVLIRLNEKLNGRDENDTAAIENQVERLIRQAMSTANQSQMFYGWQAYL